ncbi:hypothetical protein V1Y59_22340 [Gordonia sp. PKS22-38]|uniref:Transmembrane protein n=1 Tax=Gordonia prachuapensis TaxID=3115651 RepID=A0ABU7MZV7_9ACTN|nr:hypothetical protein [Gordonia sp. PKS22-38]
MASESGSGGRASGPDDTDSRPISVSELLARSREDGGTSTAPGRESRNRRRVGREGAVSVSELTGEIPRIRSADAETPSSSGESAPSTAPRRRGAGPASGPFPRSATPVARRYAEDRPVPDRSVDPAPTPRPTSSDSSAPRPSTPRTSPPVPSSGMPGFAPPATRDFSAADVAQRASTKRPEPAGASAEETENANAVTGIIPVVGDDREGLVVVDSDDVDVVDLAAPATSPGSDTTTGENFGEVMEDFDSYRAFADVEEDEPKPRRKLFGRRKNKDRSARPAAAREREQREAGAVDEVADGSVDDQTADNGAVLGMMAAPVVAGAVHTTTDNRPDTDDASDGDSLGADATDTSAAEAGTTAPDSADTAETPGADTEIADTENAGSASAAAGPDAVDSADIADPPSAHPTTDHDVVGDTESAESVPSTTAGTAAETTNTGTTNTDAVATSTDAVASADRPDETSPVLAWLLIIGQALAGLAVGVGLFWGFTELWKWNVYFALVLAVLVIFGIVTFAHLVRRTKDLTTTLLAMGVGLIVTIGPLVLLAT